MGAALEPPTWPAITELEVRSVLVRFPAAGRLIGLHWHSPRPFSAATVIETEAGAFFLKRHHRSVRTPMALAEEHDFMAHLRSAGLPVPEIVKATDGTGVVAHDGWSFELHRIGEGIDLYRDRPSWTPFLTHHHARQAGVALARTHLAARGFNAPPRGPHPLVGSFTILPARDPIAAAQAYVAARPALAHFLVDKPWHADLARLFGTFGDQLPEQLQSQPRLWTHNDWHPSNLLWSTDGAVRTIFDFGLATRTCALHDLAIAIERTAIPWLDVAEGKADASADAEAALALLEGYRTLISLPQVDIEMLISLLPLVHIEFALSEIDYFAGILGDLDKAALAWQTYLIDHARWFQSQPGQGFLQNLASAAST